jgi:hypothetical protein
MIENVRKLILEVKLKGNYLSRGLKPKQAVLISILFSSLFISLQSFAVSQDLKIEKVYFSNDSTEVLKKCIELPQLQQYYPKQTNGNSYALKIMQHGVSFSPSTNISYDGQSVLFLSKGQIKENNEDAYFYFHEFVITGEDARVEFTYNYDVRSSLKMQVVSLQLKKNSTGWFISQTKIESR